MNNQCKTVTFIKASIVHAATRLRKKINTASIEMNNTHLVFLFLWTLLQIAGSIRKSVINDKMHTRSRKTKSSVKLLQSQQRQSKRKKTLKRFTLKNTEDSIHLHHREQKGSTLRHPRHTVVVKRMKFVWESTYFCFKTLLSSYLPCFREL